MTTFLAGALRFSDRIFRRQSRLVFCRVTLALVVTGLLSAASPLQAEHPANRAVNEQVRSALKTSRALGVYIAEADSRELVYSYEPDTRRILASNTKLLTSATALVRLGPGYHFKTEVLARGRIEGGRLDGDLAIVGGGDPNFSGRYFDGDSYGVFRRWAAELRERGIHTVRGDVYLAHGFFEGAEVHPDWPKDQLSRWYEAPVSSLALNDNCVMVRVWPTPLGSVGAETQPALGLFPIRNFIQTTTRRSSRVIIEREPKSWRIELSGQVREDSPAYEKWISVPDPLAYFAAGLRRALWEEGVWIEGRFLAVEDPPGPIWEQIASFRSDLLTTLGVVNKRSQNFYAESVLKTLAAETCGRGSWAEGIRVVSDFLAEIGIPAGEFRMADGSGMSRNNRFTPRQMAELLFAMHEHPWRQEFVDTLPASGESGTSWRRRLADSKYRGRVQAKTGTLNGVSTLSGYARGRSGKLYVFSILHNETRSGSRSRWHQDAILRALIDNG